MTIFVLVIEHSKWVLKQVLYILYPICFKKNQIYTLFDLDNKVNNMIIVYILKLGFKTCYINVKTY